MSTRVKRKSCDTSQSSCALEDQSSNKCSRTENDSPLSNQLTEQEKREERARRNRASALKSRNKRRQRLAFLETEYSRLQQHIFQLQKENRALHRENIRMRRCSTGKKNTTTKSDPLDSVGLPPDEQTIVCAKSATYALPMAPLTRQTSTSQLTNLFEGSSASTRSTTNVRAPESASRRNASSIFNDSEKSLSRTPSNVSIDTSMSNDWLPVEAAVDVLDWDCSFDKPLSPRLATASLCRSVGLTGSSGRRLVSA